MCPISFPSHNLTGGKQKKFSFVKGKKWDGCEHSCHQDWWENITQPRGRVLTSADRLL